MKLFLLLLVILAVTPQPNNYITQQECTSIRGIYYMDTCMSQTMAFRIIERWPRWGGQQR